MVDVVSTMPLWGTSRERIFPYGLGWDGASLWTTRSRRNLSGSLRYRIVQLDPSDGSVLHDVEIGSTVTSATSGVAWDGTNLWVSRENGLVEKVDPADGTVLDSWSAGAGFGGLAWDGTNLWGVESFGGILRLDPSDGTILQTLSPNWSGEWAETWPWLHGTAWDGQHLWVADTNFTSHRIYKIDPSDGTIVDSFLLPWDVNVIWPLGLVWDGASMWCSEYLTYAIHKLDSGMQVDESVALPHQAERVLGMTWIDGKLWCATDVRSRMVFSYDPVAQTSTNEFMHPDVQPRDAAWDGTHLWLIGNNANRIYRVAPSGDVDRDIPTPSTFTEGLTWDGTNLWAAGGQDVYKLDAADGTVLDSFLAPPANVRGLAWDGANLWATLSNRTIYKLDQDDNGAVLASFPTPVSGGSPRGLTWDGASLWTSEHNVLDIFKIDPADGTILDRLELPQRTTLIGLAWAGSELWQSHSSRQDEAGSIFRRSIDGKLTHAIGGASSAPYGLAWTGTDLWACNSYTSSGGTFRASLIDLTNISNFTVEWNLPGRAPAGLAWDGTDLWSCDFHTGLIYRHDVSDGTVLASFPSPDGHPSGLTWDGSTLWACDFSTGQIHQLNPSNGAVLDSFAAPGGSPSGLAWNGESLWVGDPNTGLIYQLGEGSTQMVGWGIPI